MLHSFLTCMYVPSTTICAPLAQLVRLVVIVLGINRKWSHYPHILPVGLGLPVIQIWKINKPHLEVFRCYGILTKKSVLPIILILHRQISQLVKCPRSQGQNKRNTLSQYVCRPIIGWPYKDIKISAIIAYKCDIFNSYLLINSFLILLMVLILHLVPFSFAMA